MQMTQIDNDEEKSSENIKEEAEEEKKNDEQNQIETVIEIVPAPSFSALYHGHGSKSLIILQIIILFLAIVTFTICVVHSEYPGRSLELLLQGQAAATFFHHLIYILAGNYDWNSTINLLAIFLCIVNFVFYLTISVAVIRIFNAPYIYEFSYTVWSKGERSAIILSASLGCVISVLLIVECALFFVWYQKI